MKPALETVVRVEPGRLQRIAEREQEAERDARDPAAPAQ